VLIAILKYPSIHHIHIVLIPTGLYHLFCSFGFLRVECSCYWPDSSFSVSKTPKWSRLDAIFTILSPAQMYMCLVATGPLLHDEFPFDWRDVCATEEQMGHCHAVFLEQY
jgi:hypothetical protein